MRYKNNLLYKAILDKKIDMVKYLLINKYQYEENEFFISPKSLAMFWDKDIYSIFQNEKDESRIFKIEKEGKILLLNTNEFEDYMKIKYIESLRFDDFYLLKKIFLYFQKKRKKNKISKLSKWLGLLHEKQINRFPYINKFLKIKWIDSNMEFGVFAEKDLPYNCYIGEYIGVVKKSNAKDNAYCFEYLSFRCVSSVVLDALDEGNLIRFINHKSKGNLTAFLADLNGIEHIILKTNRVIKKNEQLTYDYGYSYWNKREKPNDYYA